MKRLLGELAESLGARLLGDSRAEISGVASIAGAARGDLVFVEDEKHLAAALRSPAAAVIAGEFAVSASTGRPLLIADHPKLAFARAARILEAPPATAGAAEVHQTAVVHSSAVLSAGVRVGARAVVCERARIGQGTRVGAGCAIGSGVTIGRASEIYPNVTIYPGTTLG